MIAYVEDVEKLQSQMIHNSKSKVISKIQKIKYRISTGKNDDLLPKKLFYELSIRPDWIIA